MAPVDHFFKHLDLIAILIQPLSLFFEGLRQLLNLGVVDCQLFLDSLYFFLL